jgi:hypothetical protein
LQRVGLGDKDDIGFEDKTGHKDRADLGNTRWILRKQSENPNPAGVDCTLSD